MPKLPDVDLNFYLPKPPFALVAAALILVVASWIPLALFARAYVSKSSQPRVHLWQDMDNQAKNKAQSTSPVFADNRAMRPEAPGTVARGELRLDDHLYRGFETDGELRTVLVETESAGRTTQTPRYFEGMPETIEVDEDFVRHGQQVYETFCFTCHGHDGRGNGPTHLRALSLQTQGWIQPSNLVSTNTEGGLVYGPELYADGKLYSVIANGIRSMPAYGHMIPVEDRWAVVAYVRALQLAQHAPADAVPAEAMQNLEAN